MAPMTPPAGKVAASLRTESKELPPPRSRKETVLLAVTGISAAVVTETLWALALERPPVVPDRICLLITTAGERSAEEELLSPSPALGGRTVWEALRESLLPEQAASDPVLMPSACGFRAMPRWASFPNGSWCPPPRRATARSRSCAKSRSWIWIGSPSRRACRSAPPLWPSLSAAGSPSTSSAQTADFWGAFFRRRTTTANGGSGSMPGPSIPPSPWPSPGA
ncbi:protein of unknown function [Methylacidimicrobium sp. AP8]|nr:protein of unknown function [Methylacidimicrobium sp. AP8]